MLPGNGKLSNMAYPTLNDFISGALHAHAAKHPGGQPDDDCDICTLHYVVATLFDHMAARGLDTPLTGFRFPELQGWLVTAKPDDASYHQGYAAGMDDGLHYGRDAVKAQHPGPLMEGD